MPDSPDLRLSDRERDAIAARLREARAEGRLDVVEFERRIDVLLRSTTHGEVAALTHDLPDPPPEAVPWRRRAPRHVRAFVGSVGGLWGIWLVIWVTVPWAIARFA